MLSGKRVKVAMSTGIAALSDGSLKNVLRTEMQHTDFCGVTRMASHTTRDGTRGTRGRVLSKTSCRSGVRAIAALMGTGDD